MLCLIKQTQAQFNPFNDYGCHTMTDPLKKQGILILWFSLKFPHSLGPLQCL